MCVSPVLDSVKPATASYNRVSFIRPCGRCSECRSESEKVKRSRYQKARRLLVRCHLMQVTLIDFLPVFVTLTFNDDALREKNLKQLRRLLQVWIRSLKVLDDCPYVGVLEFGRVHDRPHFHMLFFCPPNSYAVDVLHNWPYGFSNVKLVPRTFSGRYFVKYILKGYSEINSICPIPIYSRVRFDDKVNIDDFFHENGHGDDYVFSLKDDLTSKITSLPSSELSKMSTTARLHAKNISRSVDVFSDTVSYMGRKMTVYEYLSEHFKK